MIVICLVLVLLLVTQINALLYEHPIDLPSLDNYDYIIVGGGAGGSALANRLSEDDNVQVLLLEAGGPNKNVLDLEVPFYCYTKLGPGTPWDWNFTTTPQVHLDNRAIKYTRGYGLGGSTDVNCMAYSRGSASDYDRWANVTGDNGWAWDSIKGYFQKIEDFVPPADKHNATGQYDPSIHGTHGVVGISLAGFPLPIDPISLKTIDELDIPYVLDYNDGMPIGYGWMQSTVRNGTRESAATSYLGTTYMSRSNLFVLVHSTVLSVSASRVDGTIDTVKFSHPDSRGDSSIVFPGALAKSDNTVPLHVTSTREVILSAGTFGTPHILLNSGIGDARALAQLKIPSIADLPDVGTNVSDHLLISMPFLVNASWTFDQLIVNETVQAATLAQWETNHTGPYTNPFLTQIGWMRVNESDEAVANMIARYGDPSSGAHSPHIEYAPGDGLPGGDGQPHVMMSAALLTPWSRGTVTLNESDPLNAPVINMNYLSSALDIFILKQGVYATLRFISAPAWDSYAPKPSNGFEAVYNANGQLNETALDDYIRSVSSPVSHAVGSCAMSPYHASWGVVDPDLRVKKLQGLRIVDASIFPFVPAGHTTGPTYLVAERAADIIKAAYA
ncbi:pyranose dehydrogenase [Fistulina hepatica ATCC 64428]|nr:pyranose dehydrogenase [Fistulina hepatica ATCC 64428]